MKDRFKEFEIEIARMVGEHGEEHTRLYLKTYIEVMLDDPDVDEYTKNKLRSVFQFLTN